MKRIHSEPIALERLLPWDIAEALLPEYSELQYHDLEEFLANGGQLAPIVVSEDYRIVDGYNRWRTARRLKLSQIECDVYSYDNLAEMEIHAIVLNSKRRHLNKLQVARAAARMADLLSPPEQQDTSPIPADIPATLEDIQSQTPEPHEEKTPPDVVIAPVTPTFQTDRTVREVSQKLGVSHSTVKQVSKVDKSGDELLIAAMEDKVITIRQAAEIAEMEEGLRRQAIEIIDEEKRKRNNYAGVFSRTCNDCLKKLQNSRKKFKDAEFSDSEYREMKTSLAQVMNEAKELMQMLSNEMSAVIGSDNNDDTSDDHAV